MHKIIPHIWFENQACEAASWYVSVFPRSHMMGDITLHGAPMGPVTVVSLCLGGLEFQFLNAGKLADRNPSFSYMVACQTESEVLTLWEKLSDGAKILMPLDTYPFSARYGWLQDKYGVSWQIMHATVPVAYIAPCLLFVGDVCGNAEKAMMRYLSVFTPSGIVPGHLSHDGAGGLNYARFCLGDTEFVVMDSAHSHAFGFNEMQSLMVYCDTQEEIDRYTEALLAVPGTEQCGWVKDIFGISWQIVPRVLADMMTGGTPEQILRITEAFLRMKRFNVAKLEAAYAAVVH